MNPQNFCCSIYFAKASKNTFIDNSPDRKINIVPYSKNINFTRVILGSPIFWESNIYQIGTKKIVVKDIAPFSIVTKRETNIYLIGQS